MKRKRGLLAILPVALVIAFVLAASGVGNAAAPNPALNDDLVLIGNGGGTPTQNNIKVLDINAMAVVNTIGGGTSLANNHGVLADASGRYLYNSNAALATGGKMRFVKFDLGTLSEVATYDQYITGLNSGLCGIEWQGNDPASGVIWTADMSSGTTQGGLYKFDANTNQFTGDYIDVSSGADNGATCGIGWNTGNTLAYSSLMNAQKTVKLNWPAGTVVTEVADPTMLHMLDVAKTANYAYVAAHKNTTTSVGYIDIYDLSTFTLVNSFATGGDTSNPHQIHDIKVAHNEGFMYVHSREGNPDVPTTTGALDGMLFIYDLGGGGSPGASMTNPVLLGSIKSETSNNVACGTQLLTRSNYCGTPTMTVTKGNTYYANAADAAAGVVSVDYTVNNTSAGNLHINTTQITGATNNNGVLTSSAMPLSAGNIAAGTSSGTVTVKYNVPAGVNSFNTDLALSAKNLCNSSYTAASGNITVTVPTAKSYYSTWYDNNASWGMNGNWVLTTNEDSTNATVNIYVGASTTPVASYDNVAPNAEVSWQSPSTITGGPVRVVSANGQSLGVSQRVIYMESFNEVEALESSELESEYYFPWYDNNASWGMNGNWIMVTNTGSLSANVDIYIGDMTTPVADNLTVTSNGGQLSWQAPTTITNGPVKVVDSNGNRLMVSQRTIYQNSFNEVAGVPNSRLANEAWFTWYDNNASYGMNSNWICVANMSGSATTVDIFIGGNEVATDLAVGANGGHVEWQSPTTLTAGPVKVVGANVGDKLVVSQRVIYKSSFEETAPTYASQMGSNADFTWYDNNASWGMNGNWILVTNNDSTNANVDIAIAGTTAGTLNPVNANGGQGDWTSTSTLTNGPVRVTNTGSTKLVVSQRVIYKNSFNELVGRPRP